MFIMLLKEYNFSISVVAASTFNWPMVDLLRKQGWHIWLTTPAFDCHQLKAHSQVWEKWWKISFCSTLKALFVRQVFKFLSSVFDHVERRLDLKDKVNVKICDVTTWLANNSNTWNRVHLYWWFASLKWFRKLHWHHAFLINDDKMLSSLLNL